MFDADTARRYLLAHSGRTGRGNRRCRCSGRRPGLPAAGPRPRRGLLRFWHRRPVRRIPGTARGPAVPGPVRRQPRSVLPVHRRRHLEHLDHRGRAGGAAGPPGPGDDGLPGPRGDPPLVLRGTRGKHGSRTQTGGRRPHRAAPLLAGHGGRQPDQRPPLAAEGNQGPANRPWTGQRRRRCADCHPARSPRRSRSSGDLAAMARTGSPRRRPVQLRSRRQPQRRPACGGTQSDVPVPALGRVPPPGPGPGDSSGRCLGRPPRPRPPRHPHRPGQPGRLVPGGGAHRRGHRHRRTGCRRHGAHPRPRPPCHPDRPGHAWPPRTGRRGAPARPSPSASGLPPTPSASSAPATLPPSTARASLAASYRVGGAHRRGHRHRRAGLPPTWSACSAPATLPP